MLPKLNLTVERWRYNKTYQVYVSTLGNFKNKKKENLPIKIASNGYIWVRTVKGMVSVHRLVLFTWRPIPNQESMTVDHKNHNKRDNSLENLEWVTKEENLSRAKNDFYQLTPKQEEQCVDKSNRIYCEFNDINHVVQWFKANCKTKVNTKNLKKTIKRILSNDNIGQKQVKAFGLVWKDRQSI